MIISVFPWGTSSKVIPTLPDTEFDGDYEIVMDEDGGWRMRILSSGTLTFTGQKYVDIFAVGGGGGGGSGVNGYGEDGIVTVTESGGGGAGGEAVTVSGVTLIAGHTYNVIIGDGGPRGYDGGDTSIDDLILAHGGRPGTNMHGGYGDNGGGAYPYGGSGGGSGSRTASSEGASYAGAGGSDGAQGSGSLPGMGCGRTTREFGEPNGELYAGGGGGGNHINSTIYYGGSGGGGNGGCFDSRGNAVVAGAGRPNTGGGGGGGRNGMVAAPGGSGIIIIRNHRE